MPIASPGRPRHPRGRHRGGLAVAVAVSMMVATAIAASVAQASPATVPTSPVAASHIAQPTAPVPYRHACSAPAAGHAACLAIVDTDSSGRPLTTMTPLATGLHPYLAADLESAYKLPSSLLGSRQTIAIVDAYDDPDAASDLAAYRQVNNLPACDAAFPCFTKVNQEGQQGNYPVADPSWGVEESLDVDIASAICPNCHITLVEANSNADSDLEAAEDEAAALGANVISDSFGGPEYTGEAADCNSFTHPGITITVAAGDGGFGVSFPAACADVVAVGGTTLYQDSGSKRGWAETAWTGTGSGCSAFIAKPSWERGSLCGMRTLADVSAVADPDTPVAVYDTSGYGGWIAVGGTSAATPLVAGVYALTGNSADIIPGQRLASRHNDLFDVTSRSNGGCGGSYLCTAVSGFDGPTGWGTPDNIGAF